MKDFCKISANKTKMALGINLNLEFNYIRSDAGAKKVTPVSDLMITIIINETVTRIIASEIAASKLLSNAE